jgi:hypothetical protein
MFGGGEVARKLETVVDEGEVRPPGAYPDIQVGGGEPR